MKEYNYGGSKASTMPSKLSTLVSKIAATPNYVNAKIIDEFYHYMKENGASEKHMTNELQTVLYYATFLGPHTCLLDINKREQILTFLNTKQKDENLDIGGRARTSVFDGFYFNQGPHALFLADAGAAVLKELGIAYTGGIPAPTGLRIRHEEKYRLLANGSSVSNTSKSQNISEEAIG
jgi:hypothetical protein